MGGDERIFRYQDGVLGKKKRFRTPDVCILHRYIAYLLYMLPWRHCIRSTTSAHPQTHTNLHTLTDTHSYNCPMILPSQAWPVCTATAVQWASVDVTFASTICQTPWTQTHISHSLRLTQAFHKPLSSGALSPTAYNELWEKTHTQLNIKQTIHSAGLHGRWLALLYRGMRGFHGVNQAYDSSNHRHLGDHLISIIGIGKINNYMRGQ
jgi:hypothetical protein